MRDKTTEYKTKSIYFTKSEFDLLDRIMEKCNFNRLSFSDYMKQLAENDLMNSSKRIELPDYLRQQMIELIKEYIDANKLVKTEDKKDISIDPDALAALQQFDNF